MSQVPFQNIPANLRIPLFWGEVDSSQANTNQQTQRTLIIGQISAAAVAAATVAPGMPVISAGPGDGAAKGGAGSMLDTLSQVYGLNDNSAEVWFLPLADATGAQAATGTVTFAGAATAAGTLTFYVAGIYVTAAVTQGMTAAQAATALAAAVNVGYGIGPAGQQFNLPVTAAANNATVTFTAINKGLGGNDIDLEFNFQGPSAGEAMPPGLGPVITAMSGGATNPTLANALANLGQQPFDFIVSPYTDTASIAALTTLMNGQVGRWSWQAQVYGGVFMAYRGTYGALTTFGLTQNDPHTSCLGFYGSPSPVWAWAAGYAGACAASLRVDPALPVQSLPIIGVWAPPDADQFSPNQQNTLLYDGIATFEVSPAKQVSIQNAITTYQLNSQGQADDSLLEVETLYTIMAVLRSLQATVTSSLARKKLADNGTPTPPGSNIVTPSMVNGLLIANYTVLETVNGWVEETAFFAANLVVQRNQQNPGRLDVLYPPVLISQLRVFALLFQFRLLAPPANSNDVVANQAAA
jgi:phage tail sheath gpL-like